MDEVIIAHRGTLQGQGKKRCRDPGETATRGPDVSPKSVLGEVLRVALVLQLGLPHWSPAKAVQALCESVGAGGIVQAAAVKAAAVRYREARQALHTTEPFTAWSPKNAGMWKFELRL